ncbi:hypothetical protein ACLI09_16845, partial [Flavobacterium sp. RHBU_24]
MKEKYLQALVGVPPAGNVLFGSNCLTVFKNRFLLLGAFLLLGFLQSYGQTLISPTGDGGFENGTTFAANGWTVVNHPTNTNRVWYVGTGQTGYTGNRCAFIGNSATNVGSSGATRTVHIYRSITVPVGATNIVLSFKYKQAAADVFSGTPYDYIAVYTSTGTPSSGSLPSGTGTALQFGPYPIANVTSFTAQTVTLPNALAGTTTNLIFTFNADNVAPDGYGAIDDVSLTYVPAGTPNISVGSVATFGNVCTNASATNSFTLSGSSLTTADVVVGPLTGYTFSTTLSGTYTSSLALTPSSGTLSQTVYVKLTPTGIQSYNGSIPVSGGGATAISVAVTGAGVNSAPTITAAGTAGSTTTTSTTISGSAVTAGCTTTTVYGIEYSTSSTFTSGTGTQVSSANLASGVYGTNLSSLSPGITYYYRAYATNSGGTTYFPAGTPLNFTTLCNSTTVPYSLNFESVTVPAIPSCTTIQNAGSGNNWITSTGSSSAPAGKVLQYTYNSSNAANAWFFTQGLSLTGGTSYRLIYKYSSAGTTLTEKLKVAYGTGAAAADMTIQLANHTNIASTTQTTATIDFTPATTGVYYIGFNAYSAADQWNLYVDDISVDLTPSCLPATAPVSSAVTTSTATISWTASTSSPASYEYYVSTTNTAPTSPASPLTTTGTSVGLTGLPAGTQHYFWVRSLCGAGNNSTWTSSGTFTTLKLEPTNYVTNLAVSAATTAQVTFTWTAATGTVTPDGYKLTGSTTDPAATPVDGTDAANANLSTPSPVIKVAGGATTTGSLAGGTAGTMYYFKNVPYTNSGTAIDYKTDGTIPALNYATRPGNVTVTSNTGVGTNAATLNWTLPGTFDPTRHTVLVFVKQGTTAVTVGTPTADPSTYMASTTFGSGTVYQGDALAYNVYNGTGTSVTVTGLNANNSYTVGFVIVMKAANYNSTYTYSSGAAGSILTTCLEVTSFPWTENFDGMTTIGSGVVPGCWSTVTGTKAWTSANAATTTYNLPKTTPNYMNIAWSNTVASSLWTPGFALTAGTHYDFSFYYNTNGTASDYMGFTGDVLANTTASATGATNIGTFITSSVGTAGYTLYTVTFTPTTTATYYFGLSVTSTSSPWYLGVDDFKLDLTPACASPSGGYTSTSVAVTTATIGWTNPVNVPSTGYEYYYSTTNTAPLDATAVVPENIVTTNSASLTSLTTNTKYYWWVRSVCGTDKGLWASGGSFTTLQVPGTIDFVDNFEGAANWTMVNDTQLNKWYIGTAVNNGGSKSLYISDDGGITNTYESETEISVTQVYRDITIPAGTTNLALSFDWKAFGEVYATDQYDYLTVWLVPVTYIPTAGTEITSGSGRIQVGTYFGNQSSFTNYVNAAVDVSSFAGSTMRLVFQWTNDDVDGFQPAAAIDNVVLKVPCTALITSVTNGERCGSGPVTLQAVGTGATEYRWYTTASGGTYTTSTTGTWNTPSLTFTTTYYVTAYNGSCESDARTMVIATVKGGPDQITVSGVTSPPGADACNVDYVELTVGNNNVANLVAEGFENDDANTLFTLTTNNGAIYSESYYTQGTRAISLVGYGGTYGNGNTTATLTSAIDLTKYSGNATLTFDHICASQAGADYGTVQFSTNGGANWTPFPASAYQGSGTLTNTTVRFDSSSYTAWASQFTSASSTPGTAPATALFRSETINLAEYLTNTNFLIRFRYTYNGATDYYGWVIDNVKISGTPVITWAPATGLYTDAALTTAYSGSNATTVYAAPSGSQAYVATANIGTCPKTASQLVENYKKRFVGTGTDWSASVGTDWFPAGIPTVADCVTIPSGKTLTVTSGTAYANNLTVASGAMLTVNSGATLRVESNITSSQSTPNIIVNNNGAIVQGTAATANNNTGKIEFHKLSNPLYRLDYTLWSAPITGQTLRTFSMGTSNNRFYIYDYAFNGTAYVQGY